MQIFEVYYYAYKKKLNDNMSLFELLEKNIDKIYQLIIISFNQDITAHICIVSDIYNSSRKKNLINIKQLQNSVFDNIPYFTYDLVSFLKYMSSWNMPFTTYVLSMYYLYKNNIGYGKKLFFIAFEIGYELKKNHIKASKRYLDKLSHHYQLYNYVDRLYYALYYKNHYDFAIGETWYQDKVKEYQGLMRKKLKRKRSNSF